MSLSAPEIVRQLVNMRKQTAPQRSSVVKLTAAELAVVGQVVRGLSNRDVAKALRKSENTVRNQLSGIYRRLGLRSRFQLIAIFRS